MSFSATKSFSIISANVHTANRDYAAVIGMVKDHPSDIFVALEVDSAWIAALKDIETIYAHVFKFPREDNFGMAIYSKIPFKGEARELGNFGVPLLRADFSDFTLLALHPPPPVQAKMATELDIYLAEMGRMAQEIKKPLSVAGDMNATLWSDNAKHYKAAGLKSPNAGLAWTWPAALFPLAIQIDHILVRDIAVKSFSVLEGVNSDHYPVRAELLVPAAN